MNANGGGGVAPRVAINLRAEDVTSYDSSKYSSVIDWSKTCMIINGRPTYIVSAEFHYFRVPDRERWKPILSQLKGMGFNCIRLYFHWGYHSPSEGVYNFRGNRDIDFLLSICQELELFVISAPGPYICAEVQAGGFPLWLVAKRHLRIRHMKRPPIGLWKDFDAEFQKHCEDYMKVIMPILVKYERTNSDTKDGPIIAMQIENELREQTYFGIGGLDDELRLLAQLARDHGSTVPFFHNDDSPLGSWSSGRPGKDLKPTGYRTDLYGFDLYFTFPPGDKSGDRSSLQVGMIELCGFSSCINTCGFGGVGVGGSDTKCMSCLYYHNLKHAPPPPQQWVVDKQMQPAIDKLERNLTKMGGSAGNAPPVCAELQVGWINQWGRMRTYDDVYNFFGDDFSSTLLVSLAAQGMSIINHYMSYGGTNHGSIGDTEVYTSYDYSAFIREFGMLSERGRRLRLASYFVRTFAGAGLGVSRPLNPKGSAKSAFARVKATLNGALINVREAEYSTHHLVREGQQMPMYAFLRNLSIGESSRFNLIVDEVVVPVYLPVNQALIAPLYHPLPKRGWSIFASTVPVILRENYQGSELWVVRVRESEKGRIIIRVDPESTGSHSIQAQWARFLPVPTTADYPMEGVALASDMDEGAATSFLKAPLEELPLSEFDMLAGSKAPVAVKASTESLGLCFTMAFSGIGSSVIAVSEEEESEPLFRVLCLDERDADTFSADLSKEDPYISSGPDKGRFSAAWGVSEATFTPAQELEVRHGPGSAESSLFLIREDAGGVIPEQFTAAEESVAKVMPNVFVHTIGKNVLDTCLRHGVDKGNPLDPGHEVELEDLHVKQLNWTQDVTWKSIQYSERDPLDHLMTSGHVAYRLRFRTTAKAASIVLNIRHSATIWCNGQIIGRQICYSHNAMSAGSMHAVDLHHAGKKKHNLSKAMRHREEGRNYDEVIILVFSCGQSRSPFLLNDVRNKRGLLSAKLKTRGKLNDVQWYIAGVDMSRTDDAFGSSGLPFENEANDLSHDAGFAPAPAMNIVANAGVSYFRGTFKVPANSVIDGTMAYPLRLKVYSAPGVVAMLWVNGLLMGRYVADLGPQSDFYVPEGLIKECKKNLLVVAAYGDIDSTLSVKIVPWVVNPISGNVDDTNGTVFARRVVKFSLNAGK